MATLSQNGSSPALSAWRISRLLYRQASSTIFLTAMAFSGYFPSHKVVGYSRRFFRLSNVER